MFNFKKVKGDHLFRDVDDETRSQVVEKIIEASTPRKSFFVMVAVSSLVCTAGLLMESVALIIGAMLVVPMLSAILSVSLGMVVRNAKLFFRSILVVLKSFLLLFVAAFGMAIFFDMPQLFSYEFLLKTNFKLELFIVALVVGFAASLSFIRKELSQYVTGTAIAVTLLPPISASAIALRMGHQEYFLSALWIFFINFIGIVFSSMAVFIVTKFHHSEKIVARELAQEAKFLDKLTRKERMHKWIMEGFSLVKNFIKR
ncbi:MAG: TIGR00341 family protein [Candidatus Moranbacteria bacterium]|nr:TIGR00341 family protein [Candidatus Moranbacteria bacterium]